MNKTTYDIVMLVPGLPMNEDSLVKGSLGGSESAGLYMAKELSKMGHRVVLFCNLIGEPTIGADKVRYMPVAVYAGYAQGIPHDIHIVQRMPEAFAAKLASRINVLWCHDLAQGRNVGAVMGVAWNIDYVMVLSEFMRAQYLTAYGDGVAPALCKTRNAIDAGAFKGLSPSTGKHKRVIYSARAERGLDNLLEHVMPALWATDPEWELAIAGYDNPVQHLQDYYQYIARKIQDAGPRVKWLGALSKKRLYQEMAASSVYVYPSPSRINARFEEVYCISAHEAQACGLPVVATNRGALAEVVDPGMSALLDVEPWSAECGPAFAQAIHRMHLSTPAQRAEVAQRARTHDWSEVAQDWSALFDATFERLSNDPKRLFRHFWRTSDIVACDEIVRVSDEGAGVLDGRDVAVLDDFKFMHKPGGYRIQYETIGAGHDDYVYATAPTEQRYVAFRTWLQDNPQIKTVLDYGCAHGAYAINLARECDVTIVGVDIDKFSIAMANEWKEKWPESQERCKFIVAEHTDLREALAAADLPQHYDCVLAQEVLEHVPEPWVLMERLELFGRHMYITVPFGPWEYASYRTYPHRCHIWHFDQHDLSDMFGHKAAYTTRGISQAGQKICGEAIGWWVVTYTADIAKPNKPVDLKRKMQIVAPRQTVSVNILAGGAKLDETFGWCLASLVDVCDELVIGDAGMSERAKAIAYDYSKWYPVKIVPVEDPKTVGFENSRNTILENSTGDWVLWIDTDERLIDADNLHKYLRNNLLNGYGVRQFHFAVDAPIQPDSPVRLFRRGSGMKFFGAIHEHPELSLNAGPGNILMLSDLSIGHVGYLSESIRQSRFHRNLPLLNLDVARYPDRVLQKHFMIRDYVQTARMILAQTKGRLVPQVVESLESAITLYREHFLGKPTYVNADSLGYVTEALAILGRGVEVESVVMVNGQEVRLSPTLHKVRYETAEDFHVDFKAKVDKVWTPLTSKYY